MRPISIQDLPHDSANVADIAEWRAPRNNLLRGRPEVLAGRGAHSPQGSSSRLHIHLYSERGAALDGYPQTRNSREVTTLAPSTESCPLFHCCL